MSKINRKLQKELDYINYTDLCTQRYSEIVTIRDARKKKHRCIKITDRMYKMVWD